MPEPLHRRSRTGRADLLYFLCRTDRDTLTASAPLFGYQAPKEQKQELKKQSAVHSDPVLLPPQEQQPKAQESRTRQRFFRLRERTQLEQEPVTRAPEQLRKVRPFTGSITESLAPKKQAAPPPVPPPLSPWPRIWPFLRTVLGSMNRSSEPDFKQIVRSLAQGEVLTRLPQLPRPGWAATAEVIVDLDLSLHSFWQDFYDLIERLLGLRGRSGLDLLCFEDGPLGPCTDFEPERRDQQRPYRVPEPSTPILILSDLGLLSNRAEAWLTLGRRFRQAGCRPVVLMPCPERYWRGDLAEVFQLVVWDHGRRYSKSRCGCRQQVPSIPDEQQKPGLEELLAMAAAAVRVEPGLLRSLRMLLPVGQADVGTEAVVWQHGEVEADLLAFRLKQEALEKYAALLKDRLQGREGRLFQQALARIQTFHAALPLEIQFEEEMNRALLMDEQPAEDALDFMWQVAATVEQPSADYAYTPHLKAWVQRLAQRQQKAYWQSEISEPIAIALVNVLFEGYNWVEDTLLPSGFDTGKVAWLLDSKETTEQENAEKPYYYTYAIREYLKIDQGRKIEILKSIKVGKAMGEDIDFISETANVNHLFDLFAISRQNTSFPVVDYNGKMVGLISTKDYLHNKTRSQLVGGICNRDAIFLTPNHNLFDAMKIFNTEGVEEIYVVESMKNRWGVGILKRRDVVSVYNHEVKKHNLPEDRGVAILKSIRLSKSIIEDDVYFISESANINDFFNLLAISEDSNSFPVVNHEGGMIGMVSISDLRFFLHDESNFEEHLIGTICNRDVIPLTLDHSFFDAIELFGEGMEEIPVVESMEDKWIIGMLKRRDLLSLFKHNLLTPLDCLIF